MWKQREKLLAAHGGINYNHSNLFSINLSDLKKKIESIPSIEKANVARRLPDTIVLNISSRIPRALFSGNGKTWYTDDYGVVFSAASYGEIRKNIPVISGFAQGNDLQEGDSVPQFKIPLSIISTADRFYPGFVVKRLDLRSEKHILVNLHTSEDFEIYTAMFPMEKIPEKFKAFKYAFEKSRMEKTGKKIFDLRYEGQVVTR
jgi:hypothetical protein